MEELEKFKDIRPYTDEEAIKVFKEISSHPAIYSVMKVLNPYLNKEEVKEYIESFKSVDDFQRKFSYPGLRYIIDKTSDGLSECGLDLLDKNSAYLFVSTHRDIMLDTSLLNFLMFNHGFKLSEAAIGDNLIKRDLLNKLARLNRNFVVKRDAPVREMIVNSKKLSEYINFVINKKNRSVWIAQREGRTKNGKDATHPGLLKMLTLASEKEQSVVDYLKNLRIVPLAISYEYDPTDRLKINELIAKENNEEYLKYRNEDFQQIITGLTGSKKRIHLTASNVLGDELNVLKDYQGNKLLQKLAEIIDYKIIESYKLWPSNYIAYDILNNTNKFESEYSPAEKKSFLRRLEKRATQHSHKDASRTFLEMYANPVISKENIGLIR